LTYEGGKFSKGRGVGVFGNEVQGLGIPADVFRYYLLSIRPEQSDADFRWSDLAARNNGELVNNLGNFCHRTLDFVARKFGGVVPGVLTASAGTDDCDCLALGAELKSLVQLYIDHLEHRRLREGLKAALAVSSCGNAFLAVREPWNRLATDPDGVAATVAAALGLVRVLSALLAPFLPTVAGSLLHFLGLGPDAGLLSEELLTAVPHPHLLLEPGHNLGPRSQRLFAKISPSQVEELRSRFASQATGGLPK
jgi:methionyl-tRNA synthetase